MKSDGTSNPLLFVGFNQDHGCFACGTTTGFVVYNTDPYRESFRRVFPNGGIGYVEMLFRCNILALVGGGRNPRYPANKVMIWDDHQNRCIGELSFRSEVKAVKLRRDCIVVVLEHKIYVYDFSHLKLLDHIETISNPKGLCALCPNPENTVLVCPGLQKGHLRVELYDLKKTNLISAHTNSLACFALSFDGKLLVTASQRGTLIRIWDTASGKMIQELRRGSDQAEINSLCFSPQCQWLAVSSDKGTIHIFKVRQNIISQQETIPNESKFPDPADDITNPTSSIARFSLVSSFIPRWITSERSFAQFRIPEVKTTIGFGSDENTIIVASANGVFYKATFDPVAGGDCVCEYQNNFLTNTQPVEYIPQ